MSISDNESKSASVDKVRKCEQCRHCSSGGGCNGSCGCNPPRGKLHCFNWLSDIPGNCADYNIVEVQFKNTRKGFYKNPTGIQLSIGDLVAVEAAPGHDIGTVSMTGQLVKLQMKKAGCRNENELKRVFRKAKPNDIEKFEEAKAKETDTMIRSRKIAESLKLNMKIGDVEYQGDGNKAIFYYIADERVDFRQLIKVLAETFKVRIEMKQIGARQEAGRIGGIGPCGRPLCCSSWMTSFVSVATSAARYQDISLNPQKLAGQCAKLKCCLNFEVDTYVESVKRMPPKDARLETLDATYFQFKTDIFKREITYSTDKSVPANLVTIPASRAFEIIEMNKRGEKPERLSDAEPQKPAKKEFGDIIGQDDLTRFDKAKKKKKRKQPAQRQDGDNRAKDANADKPRGNQQRSNNGNTPRGNGNQPKANGQNVTSTKDDRPRKPRQQDRPQQRPRKDFKSKNAPGSQPKTERPDASQPTDKPSNDA